MYIHWILPEEQAVAAMKKRLEGPQYDNYVNDLLRNIAYGLEPLAQQVQSVFLREGLPVTCGFIIGLTGWQLQLNAICVVPSANGDAAKWPMFRIHTGQDDRSAERLYVDLRFSCVSGDESERLSSIPATVNRICAEYARSGFTKNELTAIGEISRAMKRVGRNGHDPFGDDWKAYEVK